MATWLSWPSNRALWPGHYDLIPAKFAEFAAAISRFQPVRINAAGPLRAEAERELKAAKADLAVIELTDIATDDVWCRDHGPIFVKNDRTKELALTDWEFHGWGGKFEASLDNQVPGKVAAKLGVKKFSYPFELEGGGIEVSGDGLLLTTEAVQNNPNRAAGRDDAAFHAALRDGLAIDELLWIGEGLANDDTDGHIDNLARFIAPRTILAVSESDKASPNYAPMQENLRRQADADRIADLERRVTQLERELTRRQPPLQWPTIRCSPNSSRASCARRAVMPATTRVTHASCSPTMPGPSASPSGS